MEEGRLKTETRFYTLGNSCISKPIICGSFSVNREEDATTRCYVPDYSQLKFLPRGISSTGLQLNLNENAESTIQRPDREHDVGFLCHFLKDNTSPINVFDREAISLDDAPFATYGDVLRMIASVPYKSADNLSIIVSLFRGVIYLKYRYNVEYEKTARRIATAGWGFKFKQHMLADDFDSMPDMKIPLIEGKQFYLVHKADLGKHCLLYATNIDAVICEKSEKISKADLTLDKLKELEFVQLRIAPHLMHKRASDIFGTSKSLSYWMMAYITGVNTTLCGHRDTNGVVTELKFYKTDELCTEYKRFWKANVVMNFSKDFYSYVKSSIKEELFKRHGQHFDNIRDLPRIDLVFEKKENDNFRLLLNNVEKNDSIIPEWFVELLTPK